MEGWIKVHRKVLDHWIGSDDKKFSAWIKILLHVNHEPMNCFVGGSVVRCDRGERLYSLDTWAGIFGRGWNKSSVRRFFDLLVIDKMIVLNSEHKTTRLRVCNYDAYQESRNDDETKVKRSCNDDETMLTPIKNDKNDKNLSIYSHATPNAHDERFDEFWSAYPKKAGKGDARKAWRKIKPSKATLKAILDALEWQKSSLSWTKNGGQYIPNPATYLNGSRWEDEKSGYETGDSGRNISNNRQGGGSAYTRERERGHHDDGDIELKFL